MGMESVKADKPSKGLPGKRSKRTVTGVRHEIKIKREGEWKEEEQARDTYTTGRRAERVGFTLNRKTQTGKLIQRVQMYLGL